MQLNLPDPALVLSQIGSEALNHEIALAPPLQPCSPAESNRDVIPETNMLVARMANVELDFDSMKNQIDTLNSDAEITDENIARLG